MGFIEIFIQVMPYLAVFVILEYMIKIQQKRAKEREEERKKGIIREHYVIKTEKMLTAIFIVAVFLFLRRYSMMLFNKMIYCPQSVLAFFVVSLIGSVNMIMWKLEVNGDEITWRSTFRGRGFFTLRILQECERKKGSMRVYVDGKKLFTIDSNIDGRIYGGYKRRKIPVKVILGKNSSKKENDGLILNRY